MILFSELTSRALSTICVALLGAAAAWGADDGFCKAYANKAIEQFNTGKQAGCKDLNYPQWSLDFNHHHNWCRTVSEEDAYKGTEMRVDVLTACGAISAQATGVVIGIGTLNEPGQMASFTKDQVCQGYARTAVAQQQLNVTHACNLKGPEWNPKHDDHYRWCMGLGDLQPSRDGERMRQGALKKCGAAQGVPQSVTPLPIPGSQVQGVVDQSLLPIPPPSPAIDPGVGGQTPANIDLQRLAQRAAVPPSRAMLVNALLADSATRAQLQALPNIIPQNLASQTLAGTSVTTSVSVAGSPAQTASLGTNTAPSSGPTLPAGVDWHAGIQFTPFAAPPVYYLGAQRRELGTIQVGGALVSHSTLALMSQQRVVPADNGGQQVLDFDLSVLLEVDLPNETATYLVSFGLASPSLSQIPPSMYRGQNAPIKAYCKPSVSNNWELTLAPTSHGFASVLSVQKDQGFVSDDGLISPASITLSVPSGWGFAFGGVTLTKL